MESKFREDRNRLDWSEDWVRRNTTLKWLDFYNNLQKFYTGELIKKRFPSTYKELMPYINTNNLTKRIIDEISILFQTSPSFTILNDNENIKNNFHKMIMDSRLSSVMNKVNHLEKLTYKVGVQPVWRNNKVELDIITQDRCFVWTNPINSKEVTDLFIQLNTSMNITRDNPQNVYIRWNKDFQSIVEISGGAHSKLDGTGDIINEYGVVENPYNRIPVIWFSTDIYDTFWPIKGQPIVEANELLNIDLTHLNVIFLYQTFSTLVINESINSRTNGGVDNTKIKFGPMGVIKLRTSVTDGEKPSASYITPSPKITEYETSIENRLSRLASSYGLDVSHYKNKSNGNNVESGYKLKLANERILKNTRSDRQYYLPSMKELIYLMMEVYNINNSYNNVLDPNKNEIKIDFAEVTFDSSPTEKEQIRALKTSQGIWNPILSLMEDNPDLSEEEAINKFYKIKELNKKITIPTIDLGITEE